MKRDNEFELEFLTTKEAAKILRMSSRTLETMRRNGKGPPFTRMGHDQNAKVTYSLASIREWLADKTHVRFASRPRNPAAQASKREGERECSEKEDGWIDAFLSHYESAS